MNKDILTHIERKGSVTKVAPGAIEADTLANHLIALRVAGHAVVADEVFTSENISLGVTITHYLNCKKCTGATNV